MELTGDDRLETVSITARGPDWQSLEMTIEIVSGGKTLYQRGWESAAYFNSPQGPGGFTPEARERAVRGAMAAVVGDQKALQADMMSRGHPISSEREMRSAIEWDLLEQSYPRLVNETPGAYSQRLGGAPRQSLPQERVSALLAELRERPKFIYYAGFESHYGLAWSDREGRFVRVYLCC